MEPLCRTFGCIRWFSKELLWKTEEGEKNDNPPIGIVLGAEKNNLLVEYALGGISNKLFVSRYKLYLPNKEELRKRLEYLLEKRKV